MNSFVFFCFLLTNMKKKDIFHFWLLASVRKNLAFAGRMMALPD